MSGGVASDVIEGFTVDWKFESFAETWAEVSHLLGEDDFYEIFLRCVVEPLQGVWVPNGVKTRFNELARG